MSDKTEREQTHDRLRKTAFMSVSPEEGSLLHFLISYSKAKNIIEFGCSFGISTIYLAAAVKHNNGKVITTELEPNKIAQAERNITKASLNNYVTFLPGDASKTLANIDTPIDFLFLDGAKDLYLQVFKMLEHKLNSNAIIYADNIEKEDAKPFVDYLIASEDFNVTLLFENKVLIAYYLK
ncbi:O-methyltransferase [Formosa sp. S-31]|uniref:O-methyltransferase n=1 Tax=Formosa sp. S-31 TaxID=2790949 RepID=UPI003EB817CB